MIPIEKDFVLAAYRAILRREPENTEVIEWAIRTYSSPEHMLRGFLNSSEYQEGLDRVVVDDRQFPFEAEPEKEIDYQASETDLENLLARVHQNWHFLGESDPYYSVVTWERFRNSRDNIAREEFLETGRGEIERFLRWLDRNRVKINPESTCLEYGCGTGRLTFHLDNVFQHVFAFDISEPHLKLARENCSDAVAAGKVSFSQVAALSALDTLPKVDVVFSIIVLQHNPPPIIGFILRRLLNALRPEGTAYFQIPTACRNYSFHIDRYLQAKAEELRMEMHVLPQRHVFEIVQDSGCQLLEVQPDNHVGSPEYISNTFLVRKIGSPPKY